ncbi:MAG: hypothetical protein RJB38_30 [Pseudomonadota bacterium]
MRGAYGLIGNGSTTALISDHGSIDWLCAPDFDSPSHFSMLLDERTGGQLSIRPQGPFESRQRYLGTEERSAVLETRFKTATGEGRIIDWMPWQSSLPCLLRQIETQKGTITWELFCLPRFHYGQVHAKAELASRGIVFRDPSGTDQARLTGTLPVHLEPMLGAGVAKFALEEGKQARFAWSWGRSTSRTETLIDQQDFSTCLADWEKWTHQCHSPSGIRICPTEPLWHRLVIRSEIVLRLLTHAGTGSLLESVSTSLPCVSHGTQNWDHRYCWLRHLPDALEAWLQLGHTREAESLVTWLSDLMLSTPAQDLASAYALDGLPVPDERELHLFRGHDGARPVRTGNFSARQFQLDSFSSVLQCFAAVPSALENPSSNPSLWAKLDELSFLVAQLWRRPDHGIWDWRFRPEHYLSSKLSCFRGLDRTIWLHDHLGKSPPRRWIDERQKLKDTILREGFHRDRRGYTQAFGENELDSSALLVGLWGVQSWTEPEMLSTLIMLENELRDGLGLRRTKNTHSSPDFEGTHLLSTLWWIRALSEVGRGQEASQAFTELCELALPLGLLGEGFDRSSGQIVGNFPSTRVHGMALMTAVRLSRARQSTSARLRAA